MASALASAITIGEDVDEWNFVGSTGGKRQNKRANQSQGRGTLSTLSSSSTSTSSTTSSTTCVSSHLPASLNRHLTGLADTGIWAAFQESLISFLQLRHFVDDVDNDNDDDNDDDDDSSSVVQQGPVHVRILCLGLGSLATAGRNSNSIIQLAGLLLLRRIADHIIRVLNAKYLHGNDSSLLIGATSSTSSGRHETVHPHPSRSLLMSRNLLMAEYTEVTGALTEEVNQLSKLKGEESRRMLIQVASALLPNGDGDDDDDEGMGAGKKSTAVSASSSSSKSKTIQSEKFVVHVAAYDPMFTQADVALLSSMGIRVYTSDTAWKSEYGDKQKKRSGEGGGGGKNQRRLDIDELSQATSSSSSPTQRNKKEKDVNTNTFQNVPETSSPNRTIFYMPHCPVRLYTNILHMLWNETAKGSSHPLSTSLLIGNTMGTQDSLSLIGEEFDTIGKLMALSRDGRGSSSSSSSSSNKSGTTAETSSSSTPASQKKSTSAAQKEPPQATTARLRIKKIALDPCFRAPAVDDVELTHLYMPAFSSTDIHFFSVLNPLGVRPTEFVGTSAE